MESSESKSELKDLWDARLEAFAASGLSVPQWCRENNIPPHQLRYWLQKRMANKGNSTKPQASGWIALPTIGQPLGSGVSLRVGAVSVDVQHGFDAKVLSDVIRALLQEC